MYHQPCDPVPTAALLDDHHEVLHDLVDLLLEEGHPAVIAAWQAAWHRRPFRNIDTHVRTSELKTVGSIAAPER